VIGKLLRNIFASNKSPDLEDVNSIVSQARKFMNRSEYNKAADILFPHLSRMTDNVDALILIGDLYIQLKNVVGAHYSYCLARDLQPEQARLYYMIGQGFEKMYCLEDAIDCYQRSLALDAGFSESKNAMEAAYTKRYSWQQERAKA